MQKMAPCRCHYCLGFTSDFRRLKMLEQKANWTGGGLYFVHSEKHEH